MMIKHLDQRKRVRNIFLILLLATIVVVFIRNSSLFEVDYLEKLEKNPPKSDNSVHLGIIGTVYQKSMTFPH